MLKLRVISDLGGRCEFDESDNEGLYGIFNGGKCAW